MERVLTTGQILATECRSNLTDDEKLRFAREIELAVLREIESRKEKESQGR